eukprot:Opistho-2@84568
MGRVDIRHFVGAVCALAFSIVLPLQLDGYISALSWHIVFIPLYAMDALIAYITAIVALRMSINTMSQPIIFRFVIRSVFVVIPLFVFELLLCQRLMGERDSTYSAIFSPLLFVACMGVLWSCCVVPG